MKKSLSVLIAVASLTSVALANNPGANSCSPMSMGRGMPHQGMLKKDKGTAEGKIFETTRNTLQPLEEISRLDSRIIEKRWHSTGYNALASTSDYDAILNSDARALVGMEDNRRA